MNNFNKYLEAAKGEQPESKKSIKLGMEFEYQGRPVKVMAIAKASNYVEVEYLDSQANQREKLDLDKFTKKYNLKEEEKFKPKNKHEASIQDWAKKGGGWD